MKNPNPTNNKQPIYEATIRFMEDVVDTSIGVVWLVQPPHGNYKPSEETIDGLDSARLDVEKLTADLVALKMPEESAKKAAARKVLKQTEALTSSFTENPPDFLKFRCSYQVAIKGKILYELRLYEKAVIKGAKINPWEASDDRVGIITKASAAFMQKLQTFALIKEEKVKAEKKQKAYHHTVPKKTPAEHDLDRLFQTDVFLNKDYACINDGTISPATGKQWFDRYEGFSVHQGDKLYLPNPTALHWEWIICDQLRRLGREAFSLIYGAAGTGKTTSLGDILTNQSWEKIVPCAPTGVACENLRKAVKEKAYLVNTPHSRFSMADKDKKQDGLPKWWPEHVIQNTNQKALYIADEAFFWDLRTMALFLLCVPNKAKVLIEGDPHQLKPVGWGEPARHIMDSGFFLPSQTTHLTKRWRTREGSENLDIAIDSVLEGFWPTVTGSGFCCKKVGFKDLDECVINHMRGGYQVVTPTNGLARWFGRSYGKFKHEQSKSKQIVETNTLYLNKGDKCRLLVSNRSKGVYNGMLVTYFRYDAHNGFHEVVLPDGKHYKIYIPEAVMQKMKEHGQFTRENYARLTEDGWEDEDFEKFYDQIQEDACKGLIMHAEAVTVHRAQGSEWEKVLVVVPSASRVLNREWLYVAMSRARSDCTILFLDDPAEEDKVKQMMLTPSLRKPSLYLPKVLDFVSSKK